MKALTFDINRFRWPICKVLGWVSPRVFWSRLSGLRLREIEPPPLPLSLIHI